MESTKSWRRPKKKEGLISPSYGHILPEPNLL